MSSILITGGAGFAGRHLAKRLLEEGHYVEIIDILPPSYFDLEGDFKYVWKSVHDLRAIDLHGFNFVFHFAAQADVPMSFENPSWTTYQNVQGTISLLEAVREAMDQDAVIPMIVMACSGCEYGVSPVGGGIIDENTALTPNNPYAFSKAAQELAGWAWHRAFDIPITFLSNGSVIGPYMRREVFVYKWLYNLIKEKPLVLEGGKQTRDVTYISDVVDACLLVMEHKEKANGEKFIISYGEEHTVEEILNYCGGTVFSGAGGYTHVIVNKTDYRPGELLQRERFSNSKAKVVLGYDPKIDARTGIRLTYEWLIEEIESGRIK